ncbi:hypothetical protein EST38_g6670 [Candolleomyces aberdarensis]|uniref:Uncharacterized protein n=1 Tax=Candolleomyces aberdarensis TaxID=2316362 RepID=A0A4Q2DHL7_9AGAR|nr:hypothetical protein EST38_g6670 [Candolleomyces aberdarensis]
MPGGPNKENVPVPVPVNGTLSVVEATRRQLLGKRKRTIDTSEEGDHTDEDGHECDIDAPKKLPNQDRLVGFGRHFGRTVHPFCNLLTLITEGQSRVNELTLRGIGLEDLSPRERRDQNMFKRLINMVPNLEDRLWDQSCNPDEKKYIADMLFKGMKGARTDNTKGLKIAIVEFITPPNGVLRPPLGRSTKNGRGFFHEEVGKYLCPTDYDWTDPSIKQRLRSGQLTPTEHQWPIFLYEGLKFNRDDPWDGLLKGKLVIQGFKHVFTSPSSAEAASLVYIATLIRFSLSNSTAFTLKDPIMKNEGFFTSLLSFLENPEEEEGVNNLLNWWNDLIFPGQTSVGSGQIPQTSALAALYEARRRRRLQDVSQTGN